MGHALDLYSKYQIDLMALLVPVVNIKHLAKYAASCSVCVIGI